MKKTGSLLLALLLSLAVSVPAWAETPTGGSTEVTYTVAQSYTITIPASVTITNQTGSQTISVNKDSIIPADKSLTFAIAAAANYDEANNKFRLKNDVGKDVYLDYTITYPTDQTAALNTELLSATAAEAYAGKSATLTYQTSAAQSAGIYTDTLTFTVGLK